MRATQLLLPFLALFHPASVRAYPSSSAPSCPNNPFQALTLTHLCPLSSGPDLGPQPDPTADAPPPSASAAPEPSQSEEAGEFLSFEEWKSRQIAQGVPTDHPARPAAPFPAGHSHSGPGSGSGSTTGDGTGPAPPAGAHDVQLSPPSPPLPPAQAAAAAEATTGPRLSIPLTDRYNYASDDCSARIHASSPGSKNAPAILSRKKDRYMLFQCNAPEKWVDVELCDHVRVDTIQLANYEFFSGVFRHISIYLSPRYPPGPEGWVHAGRFEARNVRAVQSFHPPEEVKGFHRFVRVVFEGAWYGNEWYCPVSMMRVYGLNEMEEWKREEWEAEALKREREREREEEERRRREWELKGGSAGETRTVQGIVVAETAIKTAPTHTEDASSTSAPSQATTTSTEATTTTSSDSLSSGKHASLSPSLNLSPSSPGSTVHSTSSQTAASATSPTPPTSPDVSAAQPNTPSPSSPSSPTHRPAVPDMMCNLTSTPEGEKEDVEAVLSEQVVSNVTIPPSQTTEDVPSSSAAVFNSSVTANTVSSESVQSSSIVPGSGQSANASDAASSSVTTPTVAAATLSTSPTPVLSSLSQPSPSPSSPTHQQYTLSLHPPPLPTGESIYRTIMNRLTLLELNTTLGTMYMEEQSRMMREALRRVEREVGERVELLGRGWEGRLGEVTKEHHLAVQAALGEMERQRSDMERERRELVSQIRVLENEVVLEKRLSLLQLCLLVVVLFVTTLTRGPGWGTISNVFRPSLSKEDALAAQRTARRPKLSLNKLNGRGSGSPDERRAILEGEVSRLESRRSSVPFSATPLRSTSPSQAGPNSYNSPHPHSPTQPKTPNPTQNPSTPRPLPRLPTLASHPSLPFRASHSLTGTGLHSPRRRVTGPHPGTGPVPGSARRLARTAHLHELRRERGERGGKGGKENLVFSLPVEENGGNESPSLLRYRSRSGSRGSRRDGSGKEGKEGQDEWEDEEPADESLPTAAGGMSLTSLGEGGIKSAGILEASGRDMGREKVWVDEPPDTAGF